MNSEVRNKEALGHSVISLDFHGPGFTLARIMVVLFQFVVIFAFINDISNHDGEILSGTTLFLFIIMTALIFVYWDLNQSVKCIRLSDEYLDIEKMGKSRKKVSWNEVTRVRYMETISGWIIFWVTYTSADKKRIAYFNLHSYQSPKPQLSKKRILLLAQNPVKWVSTHHE